MLNLGRHSGAGMPNVIFRPVLIDWILIGLVVLPLAATWACTGLFYKELSAAGKEFLIWGAMSTLTAILLLVSLRIPVKWINFPVKVTEQNIWVQYVLAIRFVCVLCVGLNLTFLFRLFHELEPTWGVQGGLFNIISLVVVGLILIALIAYRIWAMMRR